MGITSDASGNGSPAIIRLVTERDAEVREEYKASGPYTKP
jgi:hypothetical protein